MTDLMNECVVPSISPYGQLVLGTIAVSDQLQMG